MQQGVTHFWRTGGIKHFHLIDTFIFQRNIWIYKRTLQSEDEIVIEQKLFLQQLHEMDSYYVNEHIVNLLLEVRGNLRTEKQEMLSTIDRFLTLPPDERLLFTVGRRLNIFFRLDDLKKPKLHQKAGESLQQILSKNPHVDFAALCNYVRQSQI